MKVNLTPSGELVVAAESELESYALRQWQIGHARRRAKLIIDHEGHEWKGWEGVKEFNRVMKDLGPLAHEFKEWLKERERESKPVPEETAKA